MNRKIVNRNAKQDLNNLGKEKLKELYDGYGSIDKISQYVNVNKSTIIQWFEENNLFFQKRQKYTCNESFFSQDTEEVFYWAGFLALNVSIEKNRMHINLNIDKKYKLEKYKETINSNCEIKINDRIDERPEFKREVYSSASIRFNSAQMIQDLKKFGINDKVFNIPDWILEHKYLNHFIRGMFDGQGKISFGDDEINPNHAKLTLVGPDYTIRKIFDHLKTNLNFIHSTYNEREEKSFIKMGKMREYQNFIKYILKDAACIDEQNIEKLNRILEFKEKKIPIDLEKLKELLATDKDFNEIGSYFNCGRAVISRTTNRYNLYYLRDAYKARLKYEMELQKFRTLMRVWKPKLKARRERKRKYEEQKDILAIRDKIHKSVASLIRGRINKNGISMLKHLPYTMLELKSHIESLFEPWMSWKNWGAYKAKEWKDDDISTWKWNLDHIIPHSTFIYTSMSDQSFQDCWAMKNLRPYSAKQNVLDGARRVRHKK